MPRKANFSRKDRMVIANRANWTCQECHLPAPRGEADHINMVELSEDNSVENGMWLCVKCHKRKTARDATKKAKADRVRDRNNGTLKAKRPFRGWKKFDGTIVWKD